MAVFNAFVVSSPAVGGIVAGFVAYKAISFVLEGALMALTVAQYALNVAMNANPIGVLVLLITGLVAAIAILWKKNEGFRNAVKAIWKVIQNVFKTAVEVIEQAWEGVVAFFEAIWKGIMLVFKGAKGVVNFFTDIFQKAYDAITDVFDGITDFFSDLWDDIKDLFTDVGTVVGDAFSGAVKGVVNAILDFAEDNINGFIKAINGAIKTINKIPGVKISKIKELDIPKLAKGAVIQPNQPFAAILGDQTHGINIETPLDTMLDAFNRSLDSRQPKGTAEEIALLKGIYGMLGSMNLESDIRDAVEGLGVKVDNREFARVVKKYA